MPSDSGASGYRRGRGRMMIGEAEEVIRSQRFDRYRGKVQMIITSPPFPLNRRKRYGNLQGEAYKEWLASHGPLFRQLLTPNGSIVLELGNAWEPGRPVMSTLTVESLLAFLKRGDLNLCQQFVCHNPARLPSPVQWVNVERIRVKDAYTQIWWMAPTDRPFAANRAVLTEYGARMQELLARGSYNAGLRPSEHSIGANSFLRDNGGAIPSNVLSFSNTTARDPYSQYCREHGLPIHPARMPQGLVEFFIQFLTQPGDLVLDPFAGSNTTGSVAQRLSRKWIAIEANPEYAEGAKGRFLQGSGL